AERVVRVVEDGHAGLTVPKGTSPGEIRSDIVSFDQVTGTAFGLDEDAVLAVAGDDVSGRGTRPPDRVPRCSEEHVNTVGPVAQGEGTGHIGRDIIALDRVEDRTVVDEHAVQGIPRDDVAVCGRGPAHRVAVRPEGDGHPLPGVRYREGAGDV